MKKIIFLCSLLATLSLVSCHKEQATIPESENRDENIKNMMVYASDIEEYTLAILQTYTIEMQRDLFKEMSPENKARIWRERIDYEIEHTTSTEEQLAALNSLKEHITPEFWSGGSTAFVTEWTEANIVLMGYERMKGIVTTLGAERPSGGGGGGGTTSPGLAKCNCNTSSDWCTGRYATYGRCSTTVSECTGTDLGCGTLWLYSCMGTCTDTYS